MSNNKNLGGAPKKTEEEKIHGYVQVGFSKKQLKLIDAAAEEANYKQRSPFLRALFLRLLVEGKITFVSQSEVNDQLANDISGIANNCNQATRKMHETNSEEAYDDLSVQLLVVTPLLQKVIKELLKGKRVQA